MKVLCVIDHFGSGGAQRQMVNLAVGLKGRGHDVEMFIYFPEYTFFRPSVAEAGIPVHEFQKQKGPSFGVILALSTLLRRKKYDVVVSYLDTPNVYAELSRLFRPATKLIVSERSSHDADSSRTIALFKRLMHRFADCVVANSVSHRDWLRANYSWLRTRCVSVYNGLDALPFASEQRVLYAPRHLKLIAVGRVGPEKNLLNLILGLRAFYDTHGWVPEVSWVGRREESTPQGREYCTRVDALLAEHPPVLAVWKWLGERRDIPQLLADHDVLIHPGFYDGLPNVVCEALAAGKPVLAADVCDNGLLVPAGERGFLFDPAVPVSIASSLERIVAASPDEWQRIATSAREFAVSALSIDRMLSEYEWLFAELTRTGPSIPG